MTKIILPPELSFLREDSATDVPKNFKLLKSNYDADIWHIDGISKPIKLDIELDDGSKLNHTKNRLLQEQIKAWISIQSSEYIKFGGASKERITKRILIVAGILDYLLKSPYGPQIRKYGLKYINEQIVKNLLHKITSHNTVVERFYNWPETLETHLNTLVQARLQPDNIFNTNEVLTAAQFRLAQSVALKDSGLTLKAAVRRPVLAYKHIINNLYDNYLYGHRNFSIPEHLNFSDWEDAKKLEIPVCAPVRSKHETIIQQNYSTYKSCIESIQYLEMFGHEAPEESTIEYVSEFSAKFFNLTEPHKYRSIPIQVGLLGLRKSIEFALKYGEPLLVAFTNVIKASKDANMELVAFVKEKGVRALLPKALEKLEIKTWSKLIKQSDHPENREDLGLHDYVIILYGSIQIIIGILSARRQEELMDSTCESFNRNPSTFGFYIGKSGFAGIREYTHRPIPNICVQLAELIANFQCRMASFGAINFGLFASPRSKSVAFSSIHHVNYNRSLDKACRYFDLRCDKTQQAFNFRQHQLRRIFAQAFYWSAFGDLDVLRWFLAHTDKAHVYRYITEHVPGAVLNTIKAEFTAEFLSRGNDTSTALEYAVAERFGTTSFSMLDRDEFESYLAHMFTTGQVIMEPDFLHRADGEQLKFKFEIAHV
ncbi:hypothetical protein ACQKPT_17125 [Pseudomonas monteilii]|uniref:hypothetical protein n=1 Tax=Pseudomonas monteilii TaxID=76759 RepID=UPI003D00D519